MDLSKLPAPSDGFVVTHFLTVADIDRSADFYSRVLGGEVVFRFADHGMDGPSMIRLANTWVIVNVGGGPTEDKPDVYLSPPGDPTTASAFMNIRVADIHARYEEWRARGAEFLTPPQDRGGEIRCYMRDPDGYLIEVGQATGFHELVRADQK